MTPLSIFRQKNTGLPIASFSISTMIALSSLVGIMILFAPNGWLVLIPISAILIVLSILYPIPCAILAIGTIPFQQAFLGEDASIHFSLSDVLMFASLSGGAFRYSSLMRSWLRNTPMILWFYLLFLLISLVRQGDPILGGLSFARMFLNLFISVGVGYLLGSKRMGIREGLSLFVILCILLSIFILYLTLWGGDVKANYPMELNKNAVGITIGCAIVILVSAFMSKPVGLKQIALSLALCVCVAGISFTLSRGACIATAIAVMTLGWFHRSARIFIGVILCLTLMYFALLQYGSENVRSYALNLSGESYSVKERVRTISINWGSFLGSPLLGEGLGLRKEAEPHNILLTTLSETGIIGFFLFLGVLAWGYGEIYRAMGQLDLDRRHRMLLACGIAIFILTLTHGMMDVYWRRGVGAMAWIFVGYAASISRGWMGEGENEK